jgi:hypothetical protein
MMGGRDRRYLIIVGIDNIAVKYLPSAVRSAGLEPVVVTDPDGYTGESRDALRECTCLSADMTDADSIAKALRSRPELLGAPVLATSPFGEVFPVLERISASLGLVTPSPVFARLAEKVFVAALMPEYSPVTVPLDPADLPEHAPSDFSGEVVLKPSRATGAVGIKIFPSDRLTRADLADAIESSGVPQARSQRWLLQQSISGEMVSLEGYFDEGDLRVIGFSRRTRVGLTEVASEFSADGSLSIATRTSVETAVRILADRSGFASGYVHCEFLISGGYVYLIDANMGGLGGGPVIEQIALAYRLEPAEILAHSLLLPLGLPVKAPSYKPGEPSSPVFAYQYGLRDGGTVKSVSFPAEAECLHTRYAPDGRHVPPAGASDYAWIGMVVGHRAACDSAIDRISILTDAGGQRACCPASR